MDIDVVIQQSGPLPITQTFMTASDGPAMLVVAGSVYSNTPNTVTGISVILNAQTVGTASIFSNGPSTHRAVVPAYIPITLDMPWPSPMTPPSYTIELVSATGETVSDQNDFFVVALHV